MAEFTDLSWFEALQSLAMWTAVLLALAAAAIFAFRRVGFLITW